MNPENPEEHPEGPEGDDEKKSGWLGRLKQGLSKSSSKITGSIQDVLSATELDDAAMDELEEVLIASDLGISMAARMSRSIADYRFRKNHSPEEVQTALAGEIAEVLEPVAKPLEINPANKPHIVLVAGVNGSGKTTTIGKLAKQFHDRGLNVMLAAGDTFRAAAIEQLQVWGERVGAPVIASKIGGDAAGLVFGAIERAQAEGADVLLIDTAGRLQNRDDLMAELEKVVRVIKKLEPTAPHDCVLVLDATVGQNAHSQVETFKKMMDVTGLVVTKLDGSAHGGVVVALADKFGLPVHAIGVGETAEDLRAFDAKSFARALMGLETLSNKQH